MRAASQFTLEASGTVQITAPRACLPAALIAVFGFWAGTVAGGATAWGAVVGQSLLLLGVLVAGWSGAIADFDPLGLGRQGRLLVAALWIAVAAGAWASPVSRAGLVGVVLLPAFLVMPAVVGWAWARATGRRLGVRSVAVVIAAGGAWSLISLALSGAPRAAAPIGHHSLLAVWLLALLPMGVLAVRERGGWRVLGLAAGALAVAALVAGRSMAGLLGLAAEAALLLVWTPRATRWRRPAALVAAVVALGAVAWQAPRLAGVFTGTDPSVRARLVYSAAGWRGFLARPLLGWGPGSTAWTLAEWLRPEPGVNPPGEVVGELHSLPFRLIYELGVTGTALALAAIVLFVRRRLAGISAPGPAADCALTRAGLAGLAGAGVALLGTAWLEVTALPIALAVAAGAALAGRPAITNGSSPPPLAGAGAPEAAIGKRWQASGWVTTTYALAAAVILLPLDRAQLAYDRAVAGQQGPAESAALAEAVRLDPTFPLYRAALAWSLEAKPVGLDRPPVPGLDAAGTARFSKEIHRAAVDAGGVSPFWLTAGVLGGDAGAPWAAAALDRACVLDPLGALAPFYRMTLESSAPQAATFGARALLAAPVLAAATWWEGREGLLTRAVGELETWPGVDAGWRQTFAAAVRGLGPAAGPVDRLALRVDPDGGASLALRAFRRQPAALVAGAGRDPPGAGGPGPASRRHHAGDHLPARLRRSRLWPAAPATTRGRWDAADTLRSRFRSCCGKLCGKAREAAAGRPEPRGFQRFEQILVQAE